VPPAPRDAADPEDAHPERRQRHESVGASLTCCTYDSQVMSRVPRVLSGQGTSSPSKMHQTPNAVRVMAEHGIDLTGPASCT